MNLDLAASRRSVLPPTRLLLVVALLLAAAAAPGASVWAQGATPTAAPAPTPDPAVVALEAAVASLVALQTDDGAFPGASGEPDPGTTTDAVVALKAADLRGIAVTDALDAAVRYLEEEANGYAAQGAGQAAKLTLAAVAAGADPNRFGGIDIVATMNGVAAASPVASPAVPGLLGDDLYDHALVMLALAAANEPVPATAGDALLAAQATHGAWTFDGSTEPGAGDSNTTALAVQALVAAGRGDDPAVGRALDALRALQTGLGQFAFEAADPLVADANSTALVVQAIIAAGQDPTSADDWSNAFRGLRAFQNVGGGFRYQDAEPADNLLATVQAMPALAGIALPVGIACDEAAAAPGTAVVSLPAGTRAEVPCVELEAA